MASAPPADVPTVFSREAVDSDRQCRANLTHPFIAEATKPVCERGDRDAFNGVEVHRRTERDRVVAGFEDDFARQPADVGRTGCNQGAS